ncbi:MAG TPA: hypothetical protein VKM55_11330 [Candidatus Lokiarchaeia archaeon]|nr:hypothetical protein [Candidatus Lokiarchaeia archaeon]
MSTTIPIDKPTKTRLFLLKSRIEQQEGRSISYTELLQILIRNMELSHAPKHLSDFRKFQGILPKDSIEMFEKERALDLQAEERLGQKTIKIRKINS